MLHSLNIQSVKKDNNSFSSEIFSKNIKCGNLNISNSGFTYNISSGLKIGKGMIEINNVNLKYEKRKLILTSLINPQKKLLVVACSKDIFESINLSVLEIKKSIHDGKQQKNKSFLLDD